MKPYQTPVIKKGHENHLVDHSVGHFCSRQPCPVTFFLSYRIDTSQEGFRFFMRALSDIALYFLNYEISH